MWLQCVCSEGVCKVGEVRASRSTVKLVFSNLNFHTCGFKVASNKKQDDKKKSVCVYVCGVCVCGGGTIGRVWVTDGTVVSDMGTGGSLHRWNSRKKIAGTHHQLYRSCVGNCDPEGVLPKKRSHSRIHGR